MEDSKIITHIDCMDGVIRIAVIVDGVKESLRLQWIALPNGDGYGFVSNAFDNVIRMTDASCLTFLQRLIARIAQAVGEITNSDVELTYIDDHLGEREELRFIPPTFIGDVEDIDSLVEQQQVVANAILAFEQSGRRLTTNFLNECQSAGVLDDVLSMLESYLCTIKIRLDCLKFSGERE